MAHFAYMTTYCMLLLVFIIVYNAIALYTQRHTLHMLHVLKGF